ncbi:hypothetical protein [Colwellia sp. E150_009]
MKLASFHTGLHLTLNDISYRIERILTSGECYLERLSDKSILVKTKNELKDKLAEGKVELEGRRGEAGSYIKEKDDRVKGDLSGMEPAEQKLVLKRYEYIRTAIKILGDKPTKVNLVDVTKKVSDKLGDETPPSFHTVYRWWNKWHKADKNLLSLRNNKSGGVGVRKFNKLIQEEFRHIVEEVYLTRQNESIKNTYDAFKTHITNLNMSRLICISSDLI